MIIGIVGFQGDVSEHSDMLSRLSRKIGTDIEARLIRKPDDLDDIEAIIIPGGESTTIFKLLTQYSIYDRIKEMISNGLPVLGTCAGIILLSSDTGDDRVKGMELLDIKISRNAYGRQIDSFMEDIQIKGVGEFRAVFIRAPVIESSGRTEVLAECRGKPVMVRQGNRLGLTFHPELTKDYRVHEMLVRMVEGEGYISTGNKKKGGTGS